MDKSAPWKPCEFQSYCCAVIAVLGQTKSVETLNTPSNDDVGGAVALKAWRETVSRIAGVRKRIKNSYDESMARITPPWLRSLPPVLQEQFTSLKKASLGIQQFSDTIVFYSPAQNEDADMAVLGTHAILVANAIGILDALASNIPLRGAIDVAVGVELAIANLYGPALKHTYYLEQAFAQHPRILVGDGLINFLKHQAKDSGASDRSLFNVKMAQRCLQFLGTDTDGRVILDYLGPGFCEQLEDQAYQDLIERAYRFLIGEFAKFSKSGNSKLSIRYWRVIKYFQTKVPSLESVPLKS